MQQGGRLHDTISSMLFQAIRQCLTSFQIVSTSKFFGIALLSKTLLHLSLQIFEAVYTMLCSCCSPSWQSGLPSRSIFFHHVLKRRYLVAGITYMFTLSHVARDAQIDCE
jgi:hypothetical protein